MNFFVLFEFMNDRSSVVTNVASKSFRSMIFHVLSQPVFVSKAFRTKITEHWFSMNDIQMFLQCVDVDKKFGAEVAMMLIRIASSFLPFTLFR